MVQPQRVSNASSGSGLSQRALSSSLSGLFPQQQSQPRLKQTTSGSHHNRHHVVLRISMIICFLIILIYVVFYLSIFHLLFHDAKQQPSSSLLIRSGNAIIHKKINNDNIIKQPKDDLQIAVDAAKKIVANQKKAKPQSEESTNKKEILVLTTKVGPIRIVLRPDLSPESVSYVRQMATTPNACGRCNIYRAEKPGILQGIIASPTISIESVRKGNCPAGYENVPNECPEWDTECNCHGPIMTKGMVGWAAGATGPDFFMDTYENPAKWWGTQHTVFGEIQDTESFNVIKSIYNDQPKHEESGLTHLNEPLHFTLSLI
jgi:cyclophilin family peptidyl-prolyl cis-trans isomerase